VNRSRTIAWVVMATIAGLGLLVAAVRDPGPRTVDDRINAIAETIRCPTCQGEAVADSNAPTSREIRRDIALRVREGQTDQQIRAYYAESYGQDILLTPSSTGVASLVWVLPVVAVAAAAAGLVVVFRRWRSEPVVEATDDDRVLVEHALQDREGRDETDGSA
jgi:cytochrome c-type biogenesis protein CcmH